MTPFLRLGVLHLQMARSGHFHGVEQNDPNRGRDAHSCFSTVTTGGHMKHLNRVTFGALIVMVVLVGSLTAAQGHVMQNLAGTTWGAAPPFLPPGAQIAVLSGNPMAAVPYAVRLRF